MSEWVEDMKFLKEVQREKRHSNAEDSIRYLEHCKIPFRILNGANWHLLVDGDIDFWPSTGKWRARSENSRGRGVMKLKLFIQKRSDGQSA